MHRGFVYLYGDEEVEADNGRHTFIVDGAIANRSSFDVFTACCHRVVRVTLVEWLNHLHYALNVCGGDLGTYSNRGFYCGKCGDNVASVRLHPDEVDNADDQIVDFDHKGAMYRDLPPFCQWLDEEGEDDDA